MKENNNSFRQDDNQLIHTRFLNAPRDLVWEVWTNPEHLSEWWGPEGFTLTNESMEVKPGGEWNFIMHGFGKDYPNKIHYTEVVKPSLLSYKHGDGGADDKYSFTVFVSFEEIEGNKTLLTMRSVFKSAEVIAELNRKVRAIEGGKQTLDKLEKFLAKQLNNK